MLSEFGVVFRLPYLSHFTLNNSLFFSDSIAFIEVGGGGVWWCNICIVTNRYVTAYGKLLIYIYFYSF
jgi:hypothetical protein